VSEVVWKAGVHVVGTPIWCDAERTREACFVSHAGVPRAARHRQVIATDVTLKLLGIAGLAAPYGRPFALGQVRVELFPSGYCPGSASLVVEHGGERVIYAGMVGHGAETRAGDVLVIDGAAPAVTTAPEAVRDELAAWVARERAEGAIPILLCDPLARGLELVKLLGGTHRLRVHRQLVELARRLRGTGAALPPVRRLEGTPAAGEVVIWPLEARDAGAIARIRRGRPVVVEAGGEFPWSARAGRDELVRYAAATGARRVHVTGGGEALAAALARPGVEVTTLGPPRQLALLV
jgi:putative mRNA 3-end processing factor